MSVLLSDQQMTLTPLTVDGDVLRDGQLGVPRPWGHVYHQVVQRTPRHLWSKEHTHLSDIYIYIHVYIVQEQSPLPIIILFIIFRIISLANNFGARERDAL